MKLLIVAGLAPLLAAPAFAQEKTTLQYILENGVTIHAVFQGQPLDLKVSYTADGESSMKMGQQLINGTWRVDGDRFCSSNEVNAQESCYAIPPGKHPGDAFKVMTPGLGETTIEINK